jgi:transposase
VSFSPTTGKPGCPNCIRLEREVAAMREEIAELRRQINRNSGNSSMPPSSNPPWAPRPAPRKPSGRRPGGQPGHEGHHRALLPVEEVDQVVRHEPTDCEQCRGRFAAGARREVVDRHQVSELPRRAVVVTEHQAIACQCLRCGHVTKGRIPEELTRSVLGERMSATMSYLSAFVHGSRRAVEEMMAEVFGAPIALGTVCAREREMAQALALPYRQAHEAVQKAGAKNVDETGWKRAGRYLWVAATKALAVFHLDPCRNRDAMQVLLGEATQGTICTDRYGVYEKVPLEQRGICWAHLKRDFVAVAERGGRSAAIGEEGLRLCKAVMRLWHKFRDGRIDRPQLQQRSERLRRWAHRLLKRGVELKQKGTSGFCKEVLKVETGLWRFTEVEGIEPTNNHAERMLRPAVMWRKQSQGSHSVGGCRFVERIMTAVQSLRLRGRSVLDFLSDAVRALRCGLPPPSLLG